MGSATGISWCDRTWSPWVGCQKVSPACDHCYAEGWAKRSGLVGWGPGAPRRRTSEDYWRRLPRWNAEAAATGKRLSVFPSLCDPFDNAVPAAWRADHFALIRATHHLDHLLLTKRVGNVEAMAAAAGGWPANAWLGITAIDQGEIDRDLPKGLRAKRALAIPVLFLSIEPMLGGIEVDAAMLAGVDWVIAGGESGGHARPAHPDWFRSLRDQCAAAGVAFHFKQWGEWAPGAANMGPRDGLMARVGHKVAGRLLDGVLHDARPRP